MPFGFCNLAKCLLYALFSVIQNVRLSRSGSLHMKTNSKGQKPDNTGEGKVFII